MALHVLVGKGPVGSTTAAELVARGHEVRILSRSGGVSTSDVEHRQVDATDAGAADRGDARRRRALQRGQPGLPPLGHRLAAGRRRPAHGGGADRCRPRDHVEPVRLRPALGPDDAGLAAGRHRHQGPGARRGCGSTPSPPTRPAGRGSPRRAPPTSSGRRCRRSQSRTSAASSVDPEGPAGVGDRRSRRPADVGLPARRRRDARHARHRRALARPGMARAQQPAALPAAGARRPRRRDGPARRAGEQRSRGRCCARWAWPCRCCARSSTCGTSSTGVRHRLHAPPREPSD